MLTFPADKSDFSAPNGVTYAWDGTDGKWRVKAFRSIDDFIVQLQDQAPAADESKVGDLWFDTSDESLTLFVYTGGEWVPAAPPVSLDGINATIDAALIVQSDLLERVATGEVLQTSVINRLEALEGTVIDGKWYAESRSNPREGGFDITQGGLQSMGDWNAAYLRVHKTDSTGKVFTFTEVSIGDYIRIGAPASTAVYKVTEVVSGSLDWQAFGVELANSTGAPVPDLTYDFEFLPSFDPSTYATIQYVDAQDALDVKLAGENTIITPWRIKSYNKSFISVTGNEMKLYHVADPTNQDDGWAANKGYVDKKADDKLPLAGGTLTGPVDVTGDARIKSKDADGNVTFTLYPSGLIDSKNEIRVDRTGTEQCFAIKQDGTSKFTIQADGRPVTHYDVTSSDDSKVLTPKGYVDDNFINIAGQTDLDAQQFKIRQPNAEGNFRSFISIENSDMHLYNVVDPTDGNDRWAANKGYVDKMAGVVNPPPARFKWKFKGTLDNHDPIDLQPGEFIGPSLASWSYSELKWYFHKQALNMTKPIWQDYQYENFMAWQTPGPLLTMWEDKDQYYLPKIFAKMKRWEIRHGPSATNNGGPHINCDCYTGTDHAHTMSGVSLERDKVYYINFGGIL